MRLALVMVEEHARRAVHLGNDDPFRAIDDEGTHVRHQGHVAHVDVLLLDVADGAGAGFLVHVEHDETQGDLQRRCERDVALLTLLDVVFRLFQFVGNEFERPALGKVADRKDRLKDFLQSAVIAVFDLRVDLQKGVIGTFLYLDQIGHGRDCANASEILANALTFCKRLCHGDLSRIQYLPARLHRLKNLNERRRAAPKRGRQPSGSLCWVGAKRHYLTSTVAPASSSLLLISSASSLLTPSLTG